MEVRTLTMFPADVDNEQEIRIGEEVYTLRFTYRERLRGWYMSMAQEDGTLLFSCKRVAPYAPIMVTPICVFDFVGTRCEEQEDLGTNCIVGILYGEDIFYGG